MQTLTTHRHIVTSDRNHHWQGDPWPYYDVRLNKKEAAILAWFLMTPMAHHVEGFHYVESNRQHWGRFSDATGDMPALVASLSATDMDMLNWDVKAHNTLRAKLDRGEAGYLAAKKVNDKWRAKVDART